MHGLRWTRTRTSSPADLPARGPASPPPPVLLPPSPRPGKDTACYLPVTTSPRSQLTYYETSKIARLVLTHLSWAQTRSGRSSSEPSIHGGPACAPPGRHSNTCTTESFIPMVYQRYKHYRTHVSCKPLAGRGSYVYMRYVAHSSNSE